MSKMRWGLVLLVVAALSSFAGPAGAQPDPLQFVVIYVEFKRRPRERSAHAGFPDRYPAIYRRALR